jgi:plastocyanin
MSDRRRLRAGAAVVVLAIVGVAGTAGSSLGAVRPAASVTISMEDDFYRPASKRIKPRTTVTWVNDGDDDHSATAYDGSFDTRLLDPGESRSVRFRKLGRYQYTCIIHPGMTGTIKVCKMRNGVRVCRR